MIGKRTILTTKQLDRTIYKLKIKNLSFADKEEGEAAVNKINNYYKIKGLIVNNLGEWYYSDTIEEIKKNG